MDCQPIIELTEESLPSSSNPIALENEKFPLPGLGDEDEDFDPRALPPTPENLKKIQDWIERHGDEDPIDDEDRGDNHIVDELLVRDSDYRTLDRIASALERIADALEGPTNNRRNMRSIKMGEIHFALKDTDNILELHKNIHAD